MAKMLPEKLISVFSNVYETEFYAYGQSIIGNTLAVLEAS